jgi:predicted NodU family carbamoyl transferase
MIKKIINFILRPWHRYQQHRALKKRLAELRERDSFIYMGGCAMNSKTNKTIVEPMWPYRWTLPNPGDPSSSIGAVLYHTKQRVWDYNFGVAKHLEISV